MSQTLARYARPFALLVAVLILGAAYLHAQAMTPIVKLVCTAATYPACNADSHEFNSAPTGAHFMYGKTWDAQFVAGAGPNGENIIRYHLIGWNNAADEFYMGHTFGLSSQPAVPQGAWRYIRYKLRIVSPVNWFGVGGGRAGGKQILVGSDGTNDTNRLIPNLRSNLTNNDPQGDHDGSHAMLRIEKNISNGRIDIFTMTPDVWHTVQIGVRFSSTASANDALMQVWYDTGNQSAPTKQTTGYAWSTAGWSGSNARFSCGAYWGPAGVGSNVRWDLAACEYDDQFDPNWHIQGSQPAPATPPATPVLVKVP